MLTIHLETILPVLMYVIGVFVLYNLYDCDVSFSILCVLKQDVRSDYFIILKLKFHNFQFHFFFTE